MSQPVTRRRFLTGAIGAGAGAAALSVANAIGDAPQVLGATPPAITTPPGVPPPYQSYVSRPDLRPPGVWIKATPAGIGPDVPPYIFATPAGGVPGARYPAGAQQGLMIFDRNGWLVFFRPLTAKTDQAFNFHVQTYQGKPVLTWFQGTLGPGFGVAGIYAIADDTYSTIATVSSADGVPCDLHEFVITPQDTALHTGYQKITQPDIYNCHAYERDIATGGVLLDWPCYPSVPISKTFTPGNMDYFHMNSIDLWPGPDRDLLISSRNTSALYLVSRATGQILWQAGGKGSSFTMVGPGTRYEFQHDGRALPDGSGFSVFDDASPPSPEKQAWAKVLRVDTVNRRVTLDHEWNHSTQPVVVYYTGNNQLLPDGSRFVGWGSAPYFSHFAAPSAGAEMILDGRFPAGAFTYRTFTDDWVGNPRLAELVFVVHPGSAAGSFTGYASWNGATQVASWQVSAGTSSSTLTDRAVKPRHGFETAIGFTASGATQFQATALDATGHVLGTSPVVAAR